MSTILGPGSRVIHPAFGKGCVIQVRKIAYEICFMDYGIKNVGKEYPLEVIEVIEANAEVSFTEAEKSLKKIMESWFGFTEVVDLGDRWKGGKMILEPGTEGLKSKEIPIETFFHKIVMVRDRIRVMEQRINSSKLLSDEDKVNLQQYITRIYGSLTTFNILFKHKEDAFSGSKS